MGKTGLGVGGGGLWCTCRKYMWHICPYSVQGHIDVIRNTCNFNENMVFKMVVLLHLLHVFSFNQTF